MMKAGTSAEPPLRRPFSIMSVDPASGTFRLFVKAIGQGTRALCDLGEGEVALCLGPLGRPFTAPEAGREALLVAGGYGIAPFHLFSHELRGSKTSARIFYGGRTAADLSARSAFAGLGTPLVLVTEDGSLGEKGRVTEALEAHLERDPGEKALYACGPDAMLHAVAQIGARRSLPCQLSLDPWMGCGVGTCLSCVVPIRRNGRVHNRPACTEGPVFDASVVAWPGDRP
jgi:dihydroorotate dehydrogenase electron transfer subunit